MFPDADDDGSGRSSTTTKWNVFSPEPLPGTPIPSPSRPVLPSPRSIRSGVSSRTSSCGDCPFFDPRPRDVAAAAAAAAAVTEAEAEARGRSGRKRQPSSGSAHTGWPTNARSSTTSSNFWWHSASLGHRICARNSAGYPSSASYSSRLPAVPAPAPWSPSGGTPSAALCGASSEGSPAPAPPLEGEARREVGCERAGAWLKETERVRRALGRCQ